MKKLVYICALAAIAATAISCSKENAPVKMKTVSFEMGCPQIVEEGNDIDPASKTQLSGTNIIWKSDDVNIVAITDGATIGENWYTLTSSDNTSSATKTFSGTIPANENVLALYYRRNKDAANCSLSKKETAAYTIRNNHAQSQTCGDDTFNTLYNDAIAKPGDAAFQSIYGYFKWTNTANGDIKGVKVETVTDGEYFAGYYRYNYSGNVTPALTPYTSSTVYNYVANTVNTSTIKANKAHYIIVFPGTFHGLKITVTLTNNSTISFKSTATYTIEPGKYVDLGVPPIAAL